jgi:hypothetical protein
MYLYMNFTEWVKIWKKNAILITHYMPCDKEHVHFSLWFATVAVNRNWLIIKWWIIRIYCSCYNKAKLKVGMWCEDIYSTYSAGIHDGKSHYNIPVSYYQIPYPLFMSVTSVM